MLSFRNTFLWEWSSIISWPVFIWTNNRTTIETKPVSEKENVEIQHKNQYFNVSQTLYCKSLHPVASSVFPVFLFFSCRCLYMYLIVYAKSVLLLFIFFLQKEARTHFLSTLFVFVVRKNDLYSLFMFRFIFLYFSFFKSFTYYFVENICSVVGLGIFVAAFNRPKQLNRENVTYYLHFVLNSCFPFIPCVSNQIGNSAFSPLIEIA